MDTFRRDQYPGICRSSPAIVILQIGSNHLCKDSVSPEQVIANIQELINGLHLVANVRKVIFMQVLFRHQPRNPRRHRSNFNYKLYNARVNEVNLTVIDFLKDHPFALFGKHLDL